MNKLFAITGLVVATMCWAGNFIIGRKIYNDIYPVSLNFWRWSTVAIVLFPFIAKELLQNISVIKKNSKIIIILSLCGVSLFHTFVYLSLRYTQAINAALIMAIVPVIIPFFSYMLFRTNINFLNQTGIFISLLGASILILKGNFVNLVNLNFSIGDIFMIVAVILWALYTVFLTKIKIELSQLLFLFLISSIGSIMLFPAYLTEIVMFGQFNFTYDIVIAIGYISLFASLLSFYLWNKGVIMLSPNIAGNFIHLLPFFSIIFAYYFLNEKLHFYHFVGGMMIILGIFLSILGKKRLTNGCT